MVSNIHTKVSGVWKQVNGVWVKVSGAWKTVDAAWIKVSGSWKPIYGDFLPKGLILPLYGTSVPTGWSSYSFGPAFPIGVGTYGFGSTGGGGFLAGSIPACGNHGPGTQFVTAIYSAGSGTYDQSATAGGHSHTFQFKYNPPKMSGRFIKLTGDVLQLPANGIVLGKTSFSGLTELSTSNGYLFCNDSGSWTYSGQSVTDDSVSTSGAHIHYTLTHSVATGSGSSWYYNVSAGSHSHVLSVTITSFNPVRYLLSAWTHTSNPFAVASGMIGMWESATPPSGWAICDGTNGTPNLSDRIIQLVSSSNHGSATGDGSIYANVSVDAHGTHSHHSGPYSNCYAAAGAYHSNALAHAAHGSLTNTSWGSYRPSVKGIYFIMKL